MFKLLIGAAIGAAAAWFLDPNDGTRRRNLAQGKLSQVRGKAERGPADERLNDPALQAKVESEIFRDAAAPKDKVSVNVADGVVYLRGELDDRSRDRRVCATPPARSTACAAWRASCSTRRPAPVGRPKARGVRRFRARRAARRAARACA